MRLTTLALLAAVPLTVQAQRRSPPLVPPADPVPAIVQQGQIDPREDVNFSALALPSTVYVGQQVTYQIGVFLSTDVSQRLRRNPEFVPPDVRSMLAYDLPASAHPLRRDAGGREFDVHVFQRALFPLTPGKHILAPARLTYSLPLANTFFSREETHSARTGELTVIAKEPPARRAPRGLQRRGGTHCAFGARRHADDAGGRPGDVGGHRTGRGERLALSASARRPQLGRCGQRRRACRHRFGHRADPGTKDVRVGGHAAERRGAGDPGAALSVLESLHRAVRGGRHRAAVAACRWRRARLRSFVRHRFRPSPGGARALSRRDRPPACRLPGALGAPRDGAAPGARRAGCAVARGAIGRRPRTSRSRGMPRVVPWMRRRCDAPSPVRSPPARRSARRRSPTDARSCAGCGVLG